MQENDENIKKMSDDELLQGLMDALDRTIDERMSDLSDEESKFVELYGNDETKYYLLDGFIINDMLYFNKGPEGINGPYKHFPNPLRFIDLTEVNKFFKENDISPADKDWEDFEQSIDEKAEKVTPIYKDEELRFLSYFRYESGEYCYYDILEKKLVETGLLFEMSFHDEKNEVCSSSEDYLMMKMNKGSDGFIFDIIYNPEEKRYGLLLGYDIVYDIDWLKDYTNYRQEDGTENVGSFIRHFRRKEISEKEFLTLGVKKLDLMLEFIREAVDEDIKVPKGLMDELFNDYSFLFDYVADIIKKI